MTTVLLFAPAMSAGLPLFRSGRPIAWLFWVCGLLSMLAITMSATGQPCNGLSVAIDTLIISFQCAVVFGSLLANFLIYAAKTKQYGRNAFGLLAIAALSCVASYFLVLAHQQSCGLARGHWLQLF